MVFSISGAFPGIRKALVARGWVENEDKESQLWDLKYALWQRDLGDWGDLDEGQVVNYFARNSELTSKVGLCKNLSACTLDRVDVECFYPRCYDMTNPTQVEHFIEDYKATKCLCLVKRFVADGGVTMETNNGKGFPREAVVTALSICRRRAADVDDLLDEVQGPLVREADWKVLEALSLKNPGKPLKPWGKKAQGTGVDLKDTVQPGKGDVGPLTEDAAISDGSDDEAGQGAGAGAGAATQDEDRPGVDVQLLQEAREVLEALKAVLPQFGIDGVQNIWVLKPAGKSRGRGIQLSARLEKILEVAVGRGAEARWIAQKYIENPLIVNNKKFDIRQWVVVTRWNPLSAWFYQDCYCRFSFDDYDPKKLKNKYAHLTNNSISKHAEDFEEQRDETMWDSEEFQQHLAGLSLGEDPWSTFVQPNMKKAVFRSLESVQDAVQSRASSFELFGYDFMLDQDLNVWLIEVNSSPDLSYSTSTTRTLVKALVEDLIKVVIDVEKFGQRLDRPKKKWGSCKYDSGRFELLEPHRRRREEKFRKTKDSALLVIEGSSVKLRKPRRGECPEGPDVADNPRFSATALLAAAAGSNAGGDEALEDGDDEDEEEDDDEG